MRKKIRLWLPLCLVLALPELGWAGQAEFAAAGGSEEAPQALREAWRKGDWTVVSGAFQALIAGPKRVPDWKMLTEAPFAPGSIMVFVPSGATAGNELNFGPPTVRLNNIPYYPIYTSGVLKPAGRGEGQVLEFQAAFAGPRGEKADIKTAFGILPGGAGLRLTSTITNTGDQDIKDLSYSLHTYSGTRYSFSPFHREKFPRISYRLYHKQDHSLAWVSLHPPAKKDDPVPGLLPPGQSFTLDHALLVDGEGEALLQRVLDLLQIKSYRTKIAVMAPRNRTLEFVVADFLTSGVLYRDFLKDAPLLTLPLPEGSYVVTANIFPAVIKNNLTVRTSGENACLLEDMSRGTVRVEVQDKAGRYLPGKVSFIGLDPTRSPYFEPENPRLTEKGWETFKNSCYPPASGLTVALPAGVYLASASCGPEFTSDQEVLEVLDGSRQDITFRLERVLETPDLISLDPHLHTIYSDGTPSVAERLKSVVAEGVEAAVSTDHNIIVDYETTLKAQGLDRFLSVVPGTEVTSRQAAIHFNAYPATIREGEENNGTPPFREYAAGLLFRAAREKLPGALLQLNHPRAGTLGYFNNLSLDLKTAAWISDRASLDFDLMEVMNGPFYYASNATVVEDWLHLLNRGRFAPLAASSDSHSTDQNEPGYSRTYILLPRPKATGWTWPELVQSLKKGKAFASNGPLLELRVNGSSTFGDTTRAAGGVVDVFFSVRSAPWVEVSEVRLIINGERKIIFPVQAEASQPLKISEKIRLELKKDAYLVLEALGRRTLYPVVQQPAEAGQLKDAALPYALSNPVFVDVDGNGVFDPPWPEPVEFKKDLPVTQEPISRY